MVQRWSLVDQHAPEGVTCFVTRCRGFDRVTPIPLESEAFGHCTRDSRLPPPAPPTSDRQPNDKVHKVIELSPKRVLKTGAEKELAGRVYGSGEDAICKCLIPAITGGWHSRHAQPFRSRRRHGPRQRPQALSIHHFSLGDRRHAAASSSL